MGDRLGTKKSTGVSDCIPISNGHSLSIDPALFSDQFIEYMLDPDGDDNEIELEAEFLRQQGKMEVNRMAGIISSFLDMILISRVGYREGIDIQLIFDRMLNLLNILCNPGEGRPGVSKKVYDDYVKLLEKISESES